LSDQAESNESSLFQHYDCIAVYRGKGRLTFRDRKWMPCRFETGQLASGEVILLCYDMSSERYEDTAYPLDRRLYDKNSICYVSSFCGRTVEGFAVGGHGFSFFKYLPDPSHPIHTMW